MTRLGPRLRLMLWAPGLAAAAVGGLALALVLPVWLQGTVGDSLLASLEPLAALAARESPAAGPGLQRWAETLVGRGELRLTLITGQGVVLADSSRSWPAVRTMENHAERPEVAAALAAGQGTAIRRSDTTGRAYVYAARAVATPAGEVLVVRVARPLRELDTLQLQLLRGLLLSLTAAALAAMAVGFWLRRRVVRPFLSIVGESERIAGGAPGFRISEPEVEELDTLARSLNRLAQRVEEQIAAKEREREQLQEILAGMAEGVLVSGRGGRPIFVNPAFRRLFGLAADAPAEDVLALLRRPRVDELLRECLAGRAGGAADLRVGERSIAVGVRRLDALGGALVVARDVTAEARLARTRRDFVANVSHELKTPLAVIRGVAETLEDSGGDDPALVRRFNARVLEQCHRLQDLLEDLLTLSRLESPEVVVPREPVELGEVAERAVEMARDFADRRGVRLERDLGEVPPVLGDRRSLERMVLNLLDNAIKYNRRDGNVWLRLRSREGIVELVVEDTGSGIPASEQARIFERFYRLDKARGRGEGGSGLGLAIVKHVSQLHGGRVEVASTPGAGSTFTVTLPAVATTG
ncbi:MAG TPA: ATP-binding protein [Thermoanaerobaculia bacterium]|nr:ATP-binding protein [Thermoanaerobaculia bacterium]